MCCNKMAINALKFMMISLGIAGVNLLDDDGRSVQICSQWAPLLATRCYSEAEG